MTSTVHISERLLDYSTPRETYQEALASAATAVRDLYNLYVMNTVCLRLYGGGLLNRVRDALRESADAAVASVEQSDVILTREQRDRIIAATYYRGAERGFVMRIRGHGYRDWHRMPNHRKPQATDAELTRAVLAGAAEFAANKVTDALWRLIMGTNGPEIADRYPWAFRSQPSLENLRTGLLRLANAADVIPLIVVRPDLVPDAFRAASAHGIDTELDNQAADILRNAADSVQVVSDAVYSSESVINLGHSIAQWLDTTLSEEAAQTVDGVLVQPDGTV